MSTNTVHKLGGEVENILRSHNCTENHEQKLNLNEIKGTKTIRPQHKMQCKTLYYTHRTQKTIINKNNDIKQQRRSSKLRPLVSMHARRRHNVDCQIRSKNSGVSWIVAAEIDIFATRSILELINVSYTRFFMTPKRKKKSPDDKSGDMGGRYA